MAHNIIYRFLENAVDVNAGAASDGKWDAGFFVDDGDAGLLLDGGDVPIDGVLKTRLIEHHG
ncbi:MAG: hypothetical protein WBE97_02345, partial [Candidatus Acidiferrales bacterium]